MKFQTRTKRQAVAPVLATLLMIAVAVAMSVIIFMWSQGFLSNTSGATGSQQGAQNQAAQSSISIEVGTFDITANSATLIVRNVGSVSVELGSVLVQGISSNAGFKTSVINSAPSCIPTVIPKGSACSLTVSDLVSGTVPAETTLDSGDVVSVKVTTKVGTFAAAQFTVP